MASNCCGCGWGGMIAKAALITVLAGAVGLVDVYALRPQVLELAPLPPPPPPAVNPGGPGDGSGGAKPAQGDQPGGPKPVAPDPGRAQAENMITLERAKELFQQMLSSGNVHFVDARNEDEFAKGRILAAVSLPPTKFGSVIPPEVDGLSRSATIVIYCGGGDCDASKLTGLRLQELGFNDILIFHDGFPAWEKDGQPVER